MRQCDYVECENEAEYWDSMDGVVCEDCMLREIEQGDERPEDFASISLIDKMVPAR